MSDGRKSLGAGADPVNEPRLEAVPGGAAGARPAPLSGARVEALQLVLGGRDPLRGAAEAVAEAAVEELGMERAVVLVREPGRDGLLAVGSAGFGEAEGRADLLRFAREVAEWVGTTRHPVRVARPGDDARFGPLEGNPGPVRGAPLLAHGRVLGAMVVFEPAAPDGEPAASGASDRRGEGLALLAGFAALGAAHGRSRSRARELAGRLEASETRRLQAERLAAAGEVAAEMAAEIKAPLAGLGGLAGRLAREFPEDDPRRTRLLLMVQEAERLERLLGDQVELARARDAERRPDDLNRILSECLMLLDAEIGRRRLRVTRRLASGIPILLLNGALLRRIFLNLFRGVLDGAPMGGRIKVESKRRGGWVEVTVASDGAHRPGRALDDVWAPFQGEAGESAGVSASSLGLLLREQQGALRTASTPDWPVVYVLTLPIPENRDRRRSERDRRSGRDRRRA